MAMPRNMRNLNELRAQMRANEEVRGWAPHRLHTTGLCTGCKLTGIMCNDKGCVMTDRCENCLSRVVFLVPPVPRSRRCRASRSSHSSSMHTHHRPAILLWPGQQRSSRDQALR